MVDKTKPVFLPLFVNAALAQLEEAGERGCLGPCTGISCVCKTRWVESSIDGRTPLWGPRFCSHLTVSLVQNLEEGKQPRFLGSLVYACYAGLEPGLHEALSLRGGGGLGPTFLCLLPVPP